MKELEFLEIIKKTLSKSSHIGDDCAFLDELGIVITHDSLVEDVHFSLEKSSPYQVGYKAISVNLSDIFASGAIPKYFTISLSLPKYIDEAFIEGFYRACEDLSKEFDFEIVGGDITGAEKIFVSVCAIGTTNGRKIASRKNARVGDYVIATGVHGSSAAGLWLLQNNINKYPELIKKHLQPTPQKLLSNEIASKLTTDYAMMDTSDGLMDALFKIASSSNVLISVDFNKISYDKNIEEVASLAGVDYKDWILYGGEDFELVACVSEMDLQKLNADYTIIGRVKQPNDSCFVEVDFVKEIKKISSLDNTFDHFKE